MKIIALKLISGEEIIGKVVEQTEDSYTLSDVRMLLLVPTAQGIGVAVQPWLASINFNVDIVLPRSVVMFPNVNVPTDIENVYLKTVSNIQLVT